MKLLCPVNGEHEPAPIAGPPIFPGAFFVHADKNSITRLYLCRHCGVVYGTHEEQHNPIKCSVCGEPQYSVPSGITCINGHGDAPGYKDEDEVPE